MAATMNRVFRPTSSSPSLFNQLIKIRPLSTATVPTSSESSHPRTDPKPRNVQWVFLGCPGVGKGTYASRLCSLLGVPHIATGDLVREELASTGPLSTQCFEMAKGSIWATAEDLARNRGRVLSLYRQLLRSLNSPNLPLNLAARLHKKAEVRAIFMLASEERSLHNVDDLIDTGEYALSLLRKGEIPKYIQ